MENEKKYPNEIFATSSSLSLAGFGLSPLPSIRSTSLQMAASMEVILGANRE